MPQVSRPAGGAAIRIYGSGFQGTTAVLFGGVAASDFKVVDSTLLTAVTPPATANTFATISVTDNEGTGTSGDDSTRVLYTGGTMTVSPDSALQGGDQVQVSVSGHVPNADGVTLQLNPLISFLENPPEWGGGPPPYAVLKGFPSTDASGGFGPSPITLEDPFTGSQSGYDPNNVCPVSQDMMNHGIDRCWVAFSLLATGALEHEIGFTTDPTPAAPTLTLASSSAPAGSTVSFSGAHWGANPYFGSGTLRDDPGETRLVVEVCNLSQTTCVAPTTGARVALTRYVDANPAVAGVQPQFSGATLEGSLTVDNASGCAPNCVVRVRQEGYDYPFGGGTGSFLTATAPLTVTAQPEVRVGNVKVTEGDSGSRVVYAPVTLSRPASTPVSVDYATADGTATQPADYSARAGRLSFPAGSVSTSVAVPVKGDGGDEADETFRLRLSGPNRVTIARGLGLATIVDDDVASGLRLTVGDVTVDEGDATSRTVHLTVSLSAPAPSAVTVNYATTDGTATQPADYKAQSGTVTFSPGVTGRSVSVTVKADTAVESIETFKLKLSGVSGGATVTDGTGFVTIREDD